MSGRLPASNPASVLRGALAGPFAQVRAAAVSEIRRALRAPTFGEAADRLGVSRRALERLRADFPDAFDHEQR